MPILLSHICRLVAQERTLSDDSGDEGGGEWMTKPRMMTGKTSKREEPKVGLPPESSKFLLKIFTAVC